LRNRKEIANAQNFIRMKTTTLLPLFLLLLVPTLLFAQPKEVIDAYNLNQAIVGKDIDKLKKLIKDGSDVNYQYNGRNALHTACDKDSPEMIELILDAGADVNIFSEEGIGRSPLQFVVGDFMRDDSPELVEILLKGGADPNLTNNADIAPVFEAIKSAHVESLKLLIEQGASTDIKNSMDHSPLEHVNYLIERGVTDPKKQTDWQMIKAILSK